VPAGTDGPTVVAIVPMRHTSERVPQKNYRPFGGRPLYHHIVRSLLAADSVSDVLIDTDSPFIMEDAAREFPGVTVVERPEHLRDGRIAMNDVLLHDVTKVPADWYLQTHSTNPLLRPETIDFALASLFEALDRHDSLFSVTRLQTRLYDETGRPLNHDPAVLLRTQDLPPVYEENSCLYVFSRDTLEKRHNRIGARPMLFEIERAEASDIDEELDFAIAEYLFQRLEDR
jgi:CMP-N-acetylneuraminic acid synthetase